jgi:hypothetical protein
MLMLTAPTVVGRLATSTSQAAKKLAGRMLFDFCVCHYVLLDSFRVETRKAYQ